MEKTGGIDNKIGGVKKIGGMGMALIMVLSLSPEQSNASALNELYEGNRISTPIGYHNYCYNQNRIIVRPEPLCGYSFIGYPNLGRYFVSTYIGPYGYCHRREIFLGCIYR